MMNGHLFMNDVGLALLQKIYEFLSLHDEEGPSLIELVLERGRLMLILIAVGKCKKARERR
jgi:hypothetical protein